MIPLTESPLDAIIHQGQGVLIGAFRCPTTHPRFTDSGPIQNDIFVFPRSSVKIRHAGGPSFVADPTVATVYNQGQVYDRGMVSEDGDRSDWFAVPRAVASEAVVVNGLEPAAKGPFSFPFAPVPDRTYLDQRRLFRGARRGMAQGVIDEGIYALLDDVVSAAAARRVKGSRGADAQTAEIGEGIRSLIASRFEEEWPLSRLAQHFGVSTFRLCRSFRKATGSTIHRYLLSVRLRASLERLESPKTDITALALDLGFSSHSHFTQTFGRSFDTTPSACRQAFVGVGA